MQEGSNGPRSARRMAENEQIAEALNRRVEERVEEMRAEEGEDLNAPVSFFCECSDLGCRERVQLTPGRFDEVHRESALCVLVPGHEVLAVETVVEEHPGYVVVRKNIIP
jgi:hypothetical protein